MCTEPEPTLIGNKLDIGLEIEVMDNNKRPDARLKP